MGLDVNAITVILSKLLAGASLVFWTLSTWIGAASLVVLVIFVLAGMEMSFKFYRADEGSEGGGNPEIDEESPQLKCTPEYFEYIWNERKPFELRRNDRDFREGDTYYLREYNPVFKRYTGRWVEVEVLYILSLDYYFRSKGMDNVAEVVEPYCVFGIKELMRYDGMPDDSEPEIPGDSGMRLA